MCDETLAPHEHFLHSSCGLTQSTAPRTFIIVYHVDTSANESFEPPPIGSHRSFIPSQRYQILQYGQLLPGNLVVGVHFVGNPPFYGSEWLIQEDVSLPSIHSINLILSPTPSSNTMSNYPSKQNSTPASSQLTLASTTSNSSTATLIPKPPATTQSSNASASIAPKDYEASFGMLSSNLGFGGVAPTKVKARESNEATFVLNCFEHSVSLLLFNHFDTSGGCGSQR
ncbi:hypothetical protein ABKN59_006881 [Abortiporus biennis]